MDGLKNTKGIPVLVGSALGAIKLISSAYGYDFIENDLIEGTVDLVAIGITFWGIWKNNYVSKKAQKQVKVLKANKLI